MTVPEELQPVYKGLEVIANSDLFLERIIDSNEEDPTFRITPVETPDLFFTDKRIKRVYRIGPQVGEGIEYGLKVNHGALHSLQEFRTSIGVARFVFYTGYGIEIYDNHKDLPGSFDWVDISLEDFKKFNTQAGIKIWPQ